MKLYFAPLEGITTCTYRNAHAAVFGGCDGYFAPFITPSDNERISLKTLRDVVPERNHCGALTVQVLTNRADSFLKFAQKVKALGYEEININLGCPMARVVQKNRGAGFLREPEALDRFLEAIFAKSNVKISVKTRIGFHSGDEMETLMQVYNRYPLSCLIVHPRACADLYRGTPDYEVFSQVYATSVNSLCYNGDIHSYEDFLQIQERFPALDSVMLGRGALQNPALFREIAGGE
ncbi:MAG: tRNA-dihydrouridine synthase family protein, partial [Clostridia bacterium]|nr:tRNA-dihydrouridine synthase family protein [Clostridia bacterium]